MNPTKDNLPDLDFNLATLQWDGCRLIFDIKINFSTGGYERKEYIIDADDKRFILDIMPKGEYSYMVNDIILARIDDYYNMHWLVKNAQGYVHHKIVYLKPILEILAEKIYHDWQ